MIKEKIPAAMLLAAALCFTTGCESTDVPEQKLVIEVSENVEEEATPPRTSNTQKKTETATAKKDDKQNKTETTTTELKITSISSGDEELDDFLAWLLGIDGSSGGTGDEYTYYLSDDGTIYAIKNSGSTGSTGSSSSSGKSSSTGTSNSTGTSSTTWSSSSSNDYDDWSDWGDFFGFLYGSSGESVQINESGMTVETRFDVPEGYERVPVTPGSYEDFYRKLPLKPAGTPVYYYDGQKKNTNYHAAVLDFPQLKDDLLQCADACMKMRAEYLYSKGLYDKIAFTAESGVLIPFSRYVDGYRLTGSGWKSGYKKGTSRDIFDDYLRIVYSYASTRSLAKEIVPISMSDLRIGDIFVKSGSPGHSVFVVDMAVNKKTGQKIMLIGQGYMPAQDLHIVKSMDSISPWFYVEDDSFGGMDFSFPKGCQGRWPER